MRACVDDARSHSSSGDTDAKEDTVKFLLLLHGDADAEAALPHDERMKIVEEHMAYTAMLEELEVYVTGFALDDPKSSVVVRPGEKPVVTDGPFAETKEAIGGFYVVDVADREQALELATKVPLGPGLVVEVVPIIDY
jgi:hypothetical protein